MSIKNMHYDFKKKLNKVDSNQYRNFLVPEIDWALNSAYRLLVKLIAEPRLQNHLGFETSQRTIDDISALVVRPESHPRAIISVIDNQVILPENYWYFIRARIKAKKGACTADDLVLRVRRHNDILEHNPFTTSSFEWRTVNGFFYEDKIVLDDNQEDFDNLELRLTYLREPEYIHNAEDSKRGSYKLPDGTLLNGTQDCTVKHLEDDIVDLAVYLTANEINTSTIANIANKLALTKIS